MHIKHTFRTWSDKFKDLFFKNIIRFQTLNIVIKLISITVDEKDSFESIHFQYYLKGCCYGFW